MAILAQNVNTRGKNFNIVTGDRIELVFFDDDGVLGDADGNDTVSVNGGEPVSFEFLGTGTTRSGEEAAFIRIGDRVFAFDATFQNQELQNGNTRLSEPELDGETPLVLPCFLPGTLIMTPDGEIAVEALSVGDLVTTLDNGDLPIRWIGRRKLSANYLTENPNFRPVRIRANAFGPRAPAQDLWISPQHRVLVSGPEMELHFGDREMLAPAKGLTDGLRIATDTAKAEVEYIHLLFDSHQIICSNGLWTESFHPGPINLDAYSLAAKAELFQLFPGLKNDPLGVYGAAARPSLEVWEAAAISQL